MLEVKQSQVLEGWDHVTHGDWQKLQQILPQEIEKARQRQFATIKLNLHKTVQPERVEELVLLANVCLKQILESSGDTQPLTVIRGEELSGTKETASHAVLTTERNHTASRSPDDEAAAAMLNNSANLPILPVTEPTLGAANEIKTPTGTSSAAKKPAPEHNAQDSAKIALAKHRAGHRK